MLTSAKISNHEKMEPDENHEISKNPLENTLVITAALLASQKSEEDMLSKEFPELKKELDAAVVASQTGEKHQKMLALIEKMKERE